MSSIAAKSIEVIARDPQNDMYDEPVFQLSGLDAELSRFEGGLSPYAWLITENGDQVRVIAKSERIKRGFVRSIDVEVKPQLKLDVAPQQVRTFNSSVTRLAIGDHISVGNGRQAKIAHIQVGENSLI